MKCNVLLHDNIMTVICESSMSDVVYVVALSVVFAVVLGVAIAAAALLLVQVKKSSTGRSPDANTTGN